MATRKNKIEFDVNQAIGGIAWAAPMFGLMAPAYMMYEKGVYNFGFPDGVAVIVAVAVEMLGIGGVHTVMMVWEHNRKYSTEKNKVPLWIPLSGFLFYLTLITTIVVLVEVFPDVEWIPQLGRAMLVWLSVPGAVIWGVRAAQAEIRKKLRRPATQKRDSTPKAAPKPVFKCPGCGKPFGTQQGVAAHLRHHPECKEGE